MTPHPSARHPPGFKPSPDWYRAFALSRGLRRPHVHQVWGSLAGMGQRMGLYEPTGEYRPARSVRTHGHPVRVLRVKARD